MTKTKSVATSERADLLYFRKYPIRFTSIDGVPWFALDDIADAMNYGRGAVTEINRPSFPAFAKRLCWEETKKGREEAIILSPVGVWYLTDEINPGKWQSLAAWARREASRLCPNPAERDPAMFLTLLPGCKLPPYPFRYSGRRSEWEELRYGQEYVDCLIGRRSYAMNAEPIEQAAA